MYRGNGVDYTTTAWTGSFGLSTSLSINHACCGANAEIRAAEDSDFACAEILIVNQELDLVQIKCIENYFSNKYDLHLPGI